MTDDPIMAKFRDLDVPGRRKPVNRDVPKPEPEVTEWDAKPVYYMVGGVKREFFFIGHLAQALGYSVQSIRAWENQKLLPKSPYRSPKPRRDGLVGRQVKGRRLWTREQIEGILRIARECGVILNRQPPTPQFARKVYDLFVQLESPDQTATSTRNQQ